jgi:hypothetical protein
MAFYFSLLRLTHFPNRLATNVIVSSMLILGGSATVHALTGMSTIAVGSSHIAFTPSLVFTSLHSGMFLDPPWRRDLRYGRRNALDAPL